MFQQFELISYEAWQTIDAPKYVDEGFLSYLEQTDAEVHQKLHLYRAGQAEACETERSAWLITLAVHVENFLIKFFDIGEDAAVLAQQTAEFDDVFVMRKTIIWPQRHGQAVKGGNELFVALTTELNALTQFRAADDPERCLAHYVRRWMGDPSQNKALDLVRQWAQLAWGTDVGLAWVSGWLSFRRPEKLHFDHLVPVVDNRKDSVLRVEGNRSHPRDGFDLTDSGMSQRAVAAEIDYCVFCHKSEGDFCRRSFPLKKKQLELGVRRNPLGELLEGCPLDQRISEAHLLRKQGKSIASLVMIMLDNPLCALTGHRICNECMKSCIYQKQTPVNVPEIESRILKDVLNLPWGVEIYSLLMRWNPLLQTKHFQQPYDGRRVLVMGMGPAGLAMSYYLSYQGCFVVAVDGASLQPLPSQLVDKKIKHYERFKKDLSSYQGLGFGGVADYGITARWDKDLLKLLYVMFLRNSMFQCFGGIRFGGSLQVEDIWSLGFDHAVMALGAGLPKSLNLPNITTPGVFQANDFLMNLHLNQASQHSSLNEFDYALPAVVIGGGLTAIDTATEIQAYYVRMVERIYHRYQSVIDKHSEVVFKEALSDQEFTLLQTFVEHGKVVVKVRQEALMLKKPADFSSYIQSWGGVTIVYRRRMIDSPAYQRNHNEITKALEEGVFYLESLSPLEFVLDSNQQMVALRCRKNDGSGESEQVDIPARSVFMATGAKPNIAYTYEHPGAFKHSEGIYESYALSQKSLSHGEIELEKSARGVFTSYRKNNHLISFIGDVHAYYQGNVVKAIASAKDHYQSILDAMSVLEKRDTWQALKPWRQSLVKLMSARVTRLEIINDQWVKIQVHMPLAACKHLPGHIYRLKRLGLERDSVNFKGGDGIVVQGLGSPKDNAHLDFILPLSHKTQSILKGLRIGDALSILGPSGVRAKIFECGTHICVGGTNAAIYTLALAPYLKDKNAKIIFFHDGQNGYPEFLYKAQVDAGINVFKSSEEAIFSSLQACFFEKKQLEGDQIKQVVLLSDCTLSHQIKQFLEAHVWPKLEEAVDLRAGVFGPMQCLLKGICAQCLQWQIDPYTQKKTKAVYACSWQIQPASVVDFQHLSHRQARSNLQKTLNAWWLEGK